MKKALYLILLLTAGVLYAAPKRTDVWAEFTWCGTESTPTETIHKYKLKLSPNFPADQASLIVAVDVFGGGICTPLRKLGNDFRLKYSVSPAKPKRGVLERVVARIARGYGAGEIVANATLTFGGAPGHDREIQFTCRKFPKLELMTRLVLYPGDVAPLCALTTSTSENPPTTEFRFSPWEKPPRAGLFLRLVSHGDLTKVDKGEPYHAALRREALERIGLGNAHMEEGGDYRETDRRVAGYEECRLRFETGTATLAELLESEIAVIEALLNRPGAAPDENNQYRYDYLTHRKRLLDLLKTKYRAGRIRLDPFRREEREIADDGAAKTPAPQRN